MSAPQLPLPQHFDGTQVDHVWRIPYQERQREALAWAAQYSIAPASEDDFRTCLLLVDVQNTFCIPGYELFVGGRSGNGAVQDNVRLCRFIYRNLPHITKIACTLDTHTAMQIFHEVFGLTMPVNIRCRYRHSLRRKILRQANARQSRRCWEP